jgi:hypothetical protein
MTIPCYKKYGLNKMLDKEKKSMDLNNWERSEN